ncbi:MAG: DPP IV N-terminal domain-containing protein [Bacteroidales bacterium]|nr:DPP IV N-terminal domain-containing protein [Bacteroidales bacterium]
MKRALLLCCAFLPMLLNAQSFNVLDTHPAHNTGKMISQEAANSYGVSLAPERFRGDIPEMGKRPTPKYKAESKHQSLFYSGEDGIEHIVAISENDQITYGESVSRNEFGINGGIFWSPSQKKLAFYRKDESRVTDFPLLDINTRTGELRKIKYPMNGMDSELITLGIHDLATGRTVYAQVTDFTEERYLTNISWSPDDKFVFIQVLDRSQHHMKLNMYDASDGSFVRTILTEDNDQWVEPLDPLYFIKNSYQFIYRTDNRDGYRNLYLCDTLGTVTRITPVDADVEYVANDGRYVYYTSAEVSPIENHLFRLDIKGRNAKPQRLTPERGWHNITMSPDCKYFVDNYSSFNVPAVSDLRSADGKLVRNLSTAQDPLSEYRTGKVELGTIKSADGKFDNYYRLFYPVDFDPSKKYPVIVYVYGGPHSQMVNDSWLGSIRMWEMYMAQRGYIVYVQDNRGTSNRGAEFEKAINRQCGQAEMADQMVGVNHLKTLPYVDSSRIGVHGWSYGGFMTISLVTNYPDTFKVGVAGGPVIDWKWYEIMYGERYMDNPETNPEGFEKTSLVEKATNLKSKLLICQGAIDNTVVWEHSLSFLQKCISNNIPVDYFPYPAAEHNMRGIERVHLYQKISDYFDLFL